MVEITASDIFWIGQMDKISISLALLGLLCLYLSALAVYWDSVKFFTFSLLVGILSLIAWVFIPSSQTLAAMKVLPAVVNNQRIKGVAENALELTEQFLQDKLESLMSKEESGAEK